MPRLTVLLLGLVLLAAGCGTQDGGRTDQQSPNRSLSGTWVVTSMTEAGVVREAAPGPPITLEFAATKMSVSGGCNVLSGTVAYDGTHLRIDGLGGTEMGCARKRLEQETWLRVVLARPVAVRRADTLTLTAGDVELHLVGVMPPHDADLIGTTWRLDSLITGDSVESSPFGVAATLTLTGDGNLRFNDGCNTGGGSVEVADTTMRIGQLRTTLIGCSGQGRHRTGAAYANVLRGTVDYTIEGNRLTITKGAVGLGFTAK